MYSKTDILAVEAFRPDGLQKSVESWQQDVCNAHQDLLDNRRGEFLSIIHDFDAMFVGHHHSSGVSADQINSAVHATGYETLSSRSSRAVRAPTVCSTRRDLLLSAKFELDTEPGHW